MTDVIELKPKPSNIELELLFYQEMDDLLVKYQDMGMTASWQRGCVDIVSLQLASDE